MIGELKPYPAYKDSDVEWLGGVPEGWSVMPVKRLARVNPRKSEVPATLRRGTPVTFLSMEKVHSNGTFDAGEAVPIDDVWDGFTYFRRSDVIAAKITPCFENGKGASLEHLPTRIGFGSTEFIVLRPSRKVLSRFLGYLISLSAFRRLGADTMQGAGGQQRVPTEFVASFSFPLPPVEQQDFIIRFLRDVDQRVQRFVAAKERLIALLEEEQQAITHRALTRGLDSSIPLKSSGVDWLGDVPKHWDVLDLGRVVDLLPGFAFPSEEFSEKEQDIRLLRGVNITPGKIRWDETVRWPTDRQDAFASYRLEMGDLVLGLDRPIVSTGTRVARIEADDTPSLLLQRVARLRVLPQVLPEYVEYLLKGEPFRRYITPIFTGVSVPHLSPAQVEAFRIGLPPLSEQREIVGSIGARTTAMDHAANAARRQLLLLSEYRTRLFSDVVTGKLDVREAAEQLPDDPDVDDRALDEKFEEVVAT